MEEKNFDVKEMLQKQLQLLSERSQEAGCDCLSSITNAMVALSEELKTLVD